MGANWKVDTLVYAIDNEAGEHFNTSRYKELIDKANVLVGAQLPIHDYNKIPPP